MKSLGAISIGISLLFFSQGHAFDTSGFVPTTFAAWEAEHVSSAGGVDQVIDTAFSGLALTVEYTGRDRPIGQVEKEFLKSFATHVINRPEMPSGYEKEIEVRQAGKSYWVGVQKLVFPYLDKELKAGGTFTIYCRFVGVVQKTRAIYLMMEFDSSAAKNAPPPA